MYKRLKISFCSVSDEKGKITDIIPQVAAVGYGGIEIWEPHLRRYFMEGGKIQKLKEYIAKYHLEVPVISSYFTFLEGEEKYWQSIDHARQLVEVAKALACPRIRVLMDWIASRDATPDQWNQGIKALQELSAIGGARGVGFVLETHPNQLFDNTLSTLKVLRRVIRENVRVNLDIYNLFCAGENPVNSLERLFPSVAHIHLKNGIREERGIKYGIYLDSGDMDYKPFFEKLKTLSYQGSLSVEWFGERIWEAAEHEYKYVRLMLLGRRMIGCDEDGS